MWICSWLRYLLVHGNYLTWCCRSEKIQGVVHLKWSSGQKSLPPQSQHIHQCLCQQQQSKAVACQWHQLQHDQWHRQRSHGSQLWWHRWQVFARCSCITCSKTVMFLSVPEQTLFWLAAVFSLSASHTPIHLYYTCPISPHRPSDTTHTQWHHTDPVTSHRFCSTTHPPIYTKYTQLTQHRSYCTTYFHLHTQTLLHHILLGTPHRPHCTTY